MAADLSSSNYLKLSKFSLKSRKSRLAEGRGTFESAFDDTNKIKRIFQF